MGKRSEITHARRFDALCTKEGCEFLCTIKGVASPLTHNCFAEDGDGLVVVNQSTCRKC